MAATHSNLHHGGGGLSPMPKTHEDVFNPELKSSNTAGFGSDPTYDFAPNVDKYLYDQPDIGKTQMWPTTLECAKGAGQIALSRQLHIAAPEYSKFRLNTESRQKDLWRWFIEHRQYLVPDYMMTVIFVPMHIEFMSLHIKNNVAVAGLTYDLVDFYTGTVLVAGVDAGVVGCTRHVMTDDAMIWSEDCNRMVAIKLKTVPAANTDECKPGKGLLDGLNVEISAKLYCPWSGE